MVHANSPLTAREGIAVGLTNGSMPEEALPRHEPFSRPPPAPPCGERSVLMALLLIVFLPLIAALIAGLGGPWIGKTAAKAVTTGALFIGAFLSWPIFFQYISGHAGRRWSRC